MARIFVFGIGGTGSRVIKSLTILLATGVKTNDFDIVPILIDPHKDLTELKNCKKLLDRYSYFHEQMYGNYEPKTDGGFFRSKVVSLGAIGTEGLKEDFDYDSRIDDSFGDFLKVNRMSADDPNKDLINLLYSDVSLNKKLSVGFKGNPNIGSVVLNQFEDSTWYKTFGKIFSPGDKIFIISSIFGGTGASGFPLLLKNLRNHENKNIKEAEIGALPIMPYFKLSDPDENNPNKDIDSDNFFTKTKSALSYYSKNLKGLNALYYLADPHAQNTPYENDEERQLNKAHLVELIGASSIIHFTKNGNEGRQELYSYGLEEDASTVTFKNMGDPLKEEIKHQLRDYLIFSQIHPDIKKEISLPFRITSEFTAAFFKSDFFNKLEDFNNAHFLPWLKEMDANERQFSPFNLNISENKFHSLIKGEEIASSGLLGLVKKKFETANFTTKMSAIEKNYKNVGPSNKIAKYMDMTYSAINSVNNQMLRSN
jgi:hypothetical protein